MHITGLAGEPRHYAQLTSQVAGIVTPADHLFVATLSLQRHITTSAIALALSQLLFLVNLLLTLRRPRSTAENPWEATTLEWAPGLYQANFESDLLMAHTGPCEYGQDGSTFHPQWLPPIPATPEPD